MSSAFLFTGRDDAAVTLLLAHGSGAPMDSTAMNAAAVIVELALPEN
jgi:predicted alpha/beta-hydrolase family hydrolase